MTFAQLGLQWTRRRSPARSMPALLANGKSFFIETFGCQMNVHDTEKVAGVLPRARISRSAKHRRSGRDALQHLLDPRKGRAESFLPPRRVAGNCRRQNHRRDRVSGPAGRRRHFRARTVGEFGLRLGELPKTSPDGGRTGSRGPTRDGPRSRHGRDFRNRNHTPRQSAASLRDHYRRLQLRLLLLCRAAYPRAGAQPPKRRRSLGGAPPS